MTNPRVDQTCSTGTSKKSSVKDNVKLFCLPRYSSYTRDDRKGVAGACPIERPHLYTPHLYTVLHLALIDLALDPVSCHLWTL